MNAAELRTAQSRQRFLHEMYAFHAIFIRLYASLEIALTSTQGPAQQWRTSHDAGGFSARLAGLQNGALAALFGAKAEAQAHHGTARPAALAALVDAAGTL